MKIHGINKSMKAFGFLLCAFFFLSQTVWATDYALGISPVVVSATEGGASVVLTIRLEPPVENGDEVTVTVATADNSAVAPGDYNSETEDLTFNDPLVSSKTFTVTVNDDNIVEAEEQFTVALDNEAVTTTTGSTVSVTARNTTCTITDNDSATVSIADASADESGNLVFDVTLSGAVDTGFSVNYATSDGTAQAGSDYNAAGPSSLSFTGTDGETQQITVTVVDDSDIESDETMQVTLSDLVVASGRTVAIDDDTADGTIQNDDFYQVTVVRNSSAGFREGSDYTGQFSITVSPPVFADQPLTLDWTTVDGTATAGSDYTTMGGSITFATGDTTKSLECSGLSIPAYDDSVDESKEQFAVQFQVTANAQITNGGTSTYASNLEIYDDDYTVTLNKNADGTISPPSGGTPAPVPGPAANQIQLDSSIEHQFDITAEHQLQSFNVTPGPGTLDPATITHGTTSYSYTFAATDTTDPDGNGPADQTMTAVFKHRFDIVVNGDAASGSLELTTDGNPIPNQTSFADEAASLYVDGSSSNKFEVTLSGTTCVQDFVVDGASRGLYTSGAEFTPTLGSHRIEVTLSPRPSLTVQIEPVGDITTNPMGVQDRAVWKVYETDENGVIQRLLPGTEGLTLMHGHSVPIPCGIYHLKVVFDDLSGWATPVPQQFSLTRNNYSDITTTGIYTPHQFEVRFVTSGSGTGTIAADPVGTGEAGPGVYVYNAGEMVEFSVTPDSGSLFDSWQQDMAVHGSTSPVTVEINQDMIVDARFVLPCEDYDNDGFVTEPLSGQTCGGGPPYDCNDFNELIYPGATETCGDGINSNCSLVVDADNNYVAADDSAEEDCGPADLDQDGDGFTPRQGDCLDSGSITAVDAGGNPVKTIAAADIHPGAWDDCFTVNVDEDCYSFGSEGGWNTADGKWATGAVWNHEAGNRSCGEEVTCAATASDNPMTSVVQPAPPAIMFLLDDSGSMNWETIVADNNQGRFKRRFDYLFKNSGTSSLTGSDRRLWKAQWAGHNKIYYNPSVAYRPWPRWHHESMDNQRMDGATDLLNPDTDPDTFGYYLDEDGLLHADPDDPRHHPMKKNRVDSLDKVYVKIGYIDDASQYQRIEVCRRNNSNHGGSTLADAVALDFTNMKDPGHQNATHDTGGFFEDKYCSWYYDSWWDGNPHKKNGNYYTCSSYAPDIIFDDKDYIFSMSGDWHRSSLDKWEWRYSAYYTAVNDRCATWFLNLEQDGDYYVYAWADDDDNRDRNAEYRVYHDHDGNSATPLQRTDLYFDQVNEGKHWHILDKDTPLPFSSQEVPYYEINISHYYVWNDDNGDTVQDNDEIYLVNLSGRIDDDSIDRQYYKINDKNDNDFIDHDEITLLDSAITDTSDPRYVPDGVRAKDAEGNYLSPAAERRNFADWYSFYRKRQFTAKAAVGHTIEDMENAMVGLLTIHQRKKRPVVPIDLMDDTGVTHDQTEDLLNSLYGVNASGGTPLRQGLALVGEYYRTAILAGKKACEKDPSNDHAEICNSGDPQPAISPWSTPGSGGTCQKAFVVAMTDGYWNGGKPYGNAAAASHDHDTSYSPTQFDRGIFKDSGGHTGEVSLADVAMYYYEHDLNSGLANDVPAKGFDIAGHQHMTTYGVAFGVIGVHNPESFPDCLPDEAYNTDGSNTPGIVYNNGEYVASGNPLLDGQPKYFDLSGSNTTPVTPTWKDVEGNDTTYPVYRNYCPRWAGDDNRVDDLFHASVNGRGKFLSASNPEELIEALGEIRKLIASQVTSATSLATNDIWLDSDTLLFQVAYQKKQWAGNIFAYCLDDNGFVANCPGTTSKIKWNAHKVAENQGSSWWSSIRQVITYNDETRKGVPFRYGNLSAVQKASLGDEEIVNYIRGDRSNEKQNGGTLRDRLTYFGDMVNSNPVHYADVLFAGANDGGLHAFDAVTGQELFTYIPSLVYRDFASMPMPSWHDKLYYFTQGGYEIIHKFFVDNSVDLKYIDDNTTYLVGTLRKGGRGLYALNVKGIKEGGIESKAADIVKWEYPVAPHDDVDNDGDGTVDEADEKYGYTGANAALTFENHSDPYLGYSYSEPQICKVKINGDYKWVVIIGNGYESYRKAAALYIIDLETGDLVRRIVAHEPDPATTKDCNGLSMPAISDLDLDGSADLVYAGDLLGNLWKFDLRDPDPAQWDVFFQDTDGSKQPLFRAKNKQGYRQPITMKPVVTSPCVFNGKGKMVIFGTGRFIGEKDLDDVSVQTLYGIWDWSDAWAAYYEKQGDSSDLAHEKSRKTYLGSFEKLLTSAEETICQTNCTTDCEDTGKALCLNHKETCISSCTDSHADCNSNCADIEAGCQDTCLTARNTCVTDCAANWDPVTQTADYNACVASCDANQSTCNATCSSDRSSCEGVCDSNKTSCETACDSASADCENEVTNTLCNTPGASEDACVLACTSTYSSCLTAAGGDPALRQKCVEDFELCQSTCLAYWHCIDYCGTGERGLSHIEDIPDFSASKAKFVTMLEQTQIWAGGISFYKKGEMVVGGVDYEGYLKNIDYNPDNLSNYDAYVRVLSEHKTNWFDFDAYEEHSFSYPEQAVHAGWYFDFTLTGERQVSDMLLNGGVLTLNSIIPSRSPCTSGGNTYTQFVDYCSGGTLESPYIDINGDHVIDEDDTIDIGSPANVIKTAVSGVLSYGVQSTPSVIATRDGKGVMHLPMLKVIQGSDNVKEGGVPIAGSVIEGPNYGMYFWREIP